MAESANSGEALENLAKVAALDAAIARGLNDAESGRVRPSSEVFDRLQAGLAGKDDRLPSSKSPED